MVTISHEGYVKRMPLTEYRMQDRGGKGVQGGLRDNDFVEHFFVARRTPTCSASPTAGRCTG